MSFRDFPFLKEISGSSLKISRRKGWFCIKCHFPIKTFFRNLRVFLQKIFTKFLQKNYKKSHLNTTSDRNYSNLTGWQGPIRMHHFRSYHTTLVAIKTQNCHTIRRNGSEFNTLPFPITNLQIATDENRKIRNRGLACKLTLLATAS